MNALKEYRIKSLIELNHSEFTKIVLESNRKPLNLIDSLSTQRLTAAQFKNRWCWFTANHGAGFTDEMRMRTACGYLHSPSQYTSLKSIAFLVICLELPERSNSRNHLWKGFHVKSVCISKHLCAGNVAVRSDYFCGVWLLGDKRKPLLMDVIQTKDRFSCITVRCVWEISHAAQNMVLMDPD